jgi:hypothetical protein
MTALRDTPMREISTSTTSPAKIARELGMARSSNYRILEEAAGKKVKAAHRVAKGTGPR